VISGGKNLALALPKTSRLPCRIGVTGKSLHFDEEASPSGKLGLPKQPGWSLRATPELAIGRLLHKFEALYWDFQEAHDALGQTAATLIARSTED
jgi:hypothetical protein